MVTGQNGVHGEHVTQQTGSSHVAELVQTLHQPMGDNNVPQHQPELQKVNHVPFRVSSVFSSLVHYLSITIDYGHRSFSSQLDMRIRAESSLKNTGYYMYRMLTLTNDTIPIPYL